MKIVIAIDSFKGSLTSMQAGNAAAEGIRRVLPDAQILIRPVADGGEGTVDALVEGLGGVKQSVSVSDPLGRSIVCEYGMIPTSKTAIIEMSAAAGLPLLSLKERNPLLTTTYGVGEMIRDAIGRGCRDFLIGIGGSATNDGGVGMLQALGFGFLDGEGKQIPHGAQGLEKLCQITDRDALKELRDCRFSVACDVTNPLCGECGCSVIFAPQKGATAEQIEVMDLWLSRYATLARTVCSKADPNLPGAGAAGGMGFAFSAFLGATLQRGIELVLDRIGLEEALRDADLVLTGEGRLDAQTAMGKAPSGVAALAKRYRKRVIALAGCVTKEAKACHDCGIDAFFPIVRGACSLEEAMEPLVAYGNMADTAEQIMRLIGHT